MEGFSAVFNCVVLIFDRFELRHSYHLNIVTSTSAATANTSCISVSAGAITSESDRQIAPKKKLRFGHVCCGGIFQFQFTHHLDWCRAPR